MLVILPTFLSVSVLLAMTPGSDNIFAPTQSALRGRATGILVALGLCTRLLTHTCTVTLGIAVLAVKPVTTEH